METAEKLEQILIESAQEIYRDLDSEFNPLVNSVLAEFHEEIGDSTIRANFMTLQRAALEKITDRIDRLGSEAQKLCQRWLRLIRNRLFSLYQDAISKDDLEGLFPVGITHSEQEFCHTLIKEKTRLLQILDLLEENHFMPEHLRSQLEKPELTEKVKFKLLEEVLMEHSDSLEGTSYLQNPTLALVDRIRKQTLQQRQLLIEPETIRLLLQRAGIPTTGHLEIQRQKRLGNSNFSFFVRVGGEKYFIRYHDPLGFRYFQRHSPRKTTFYSVLAEHIFAELLGPHRVVGTLFPDVETATKQYLGAETVDPIEKLAQRVLIQPNLGETHCELIHFSELGLTYRDAVRIYAAALAEVHASSSGIVRHYRNQSNPDTRLMQLLDTVGQDIRFADQANYKTWLQGPNWVTRMFHALEDSYHEHNAFYHDVKNNLKTEGVDIHEAFAEASEKSAERFGAQGCVGHLDFKINNLFALRDNPEETIVYDFDYVTFLEPAYEAGHSLYSVISQAIAVAKIEDYETMVDLVRTFNTSYSLAFENQLSTRNFAGDRHTVNRNRLEAASNFFAGLTILTVFASEYKKHGLTPSQIEAVKKISLDLLRG